MALNTTDITLDFGSGWLAIPCTGTVVHIVKIVNTDIEVRLGISSTSNGFVLKQGDTLKAEETVYVRQYGINSAEIPGVTVVRPTITVVKD